MSATQMNLRLDAQVKEHGDAALAQVGYSPSQAVRALWEFAAAHVHDPQAVKGLLQQVTVTQEPQREARIAAKIAALDHALNLQKQLEAVVGQSQDVAGSSIPDRALRGDALFARWEERRLM